MYVQRYSIFENAEIKKVVLSQIKEYFFQTMRLFLSFLLSSSRKLQHNIEDKGFCYF